MLDKFSWVAVVTCVISWLVLVGDAVLPDAVFALRPQMGRLVAAVACVSAVGLLVRHLQRPVEEVFDAGREYERRCQLKAANRRATVTPIRRAPKGLSEFNRERAGV